MITDESNEGVFLKSVQECIRWTNEDDTGDARLDGWDALASIAREFIAIAAPWLDNVESKVLRKKVYQQAGHDFALTCEGHGTGFWDREEFYGKHFATRLTDLCECIYLETSADFESEDAPCIDIYCGYFGAVSSLWEAWVMADGPMGIPVSIFRAAGGQDCSNGGLSANHARAVLIGPGLPELAKPDSDRPALYVQKRELSGKDGPYAYFHCEPKAQCVRGDWYMFGGNFCYTSDSRFSETVGKRPLPIHDRREG